MTPEETLLKTIFGRGLPQMERDEMQDKPRTRIVRKVESLCETCKWSQCMRDDSDLLRVYCSYAERMVGFPVVECSRYYDAAKPDISQYEKTAWIIVPKPDSSRIGFVRPGTAEHRRVRATRED